MPEPKRPLKVFLCHAHADRDSVRGLYAHLTKDGVDVWLDKEKLLGGEDWEFEIRNAVRESDIVVVCHSRQFNQKGFRQKEVKIALEEADLLPKGEIFIIPVRLEECEVLDDLKRWHWVDLFEPDGYERLLRALRTRADKIGATIQIKKKWLPTVNTQPAIVEKLLAPVKKENEGKQEISEIGLVHTTSSPKRRLSLKRLISIMVQGFLIVMVVASLVLTFWNPTFPNPSFLNSAQVDTTPSFAAQPNETFSVIQTKISTATPTSLPTEITDAKGVSMMLVPAGDFTMGSDHSNDEKPVHIVNLDAFYIDKYEVTNVLYKACVSSDVCDPPKPSELFKDYESSSRHSYYSNSVFDNYPVILVDWYMAKTYCEWRGAQLPTEAQWEKAARGIDGRNYPWGEDISCNKANYSSTVENRFCVGDTSQVGSYKDGVSPYGVYDMAGNVWEWVGDWYSATYYHEAPSSNPLGPSLGQERVVRGGTWLSYESGLSSSDRVWYEPFSLRNDVGFRCARNANP